MTWADVSWKNAWIHLKMEKTRHEVVVPISEPCKTALKECQSRSIVAEVVFVDEAGAPLSVTRIRRAFALAKQLAGITRKVRFRDLRHTYGSSLSSDGLSLAIIGKVMGHKHQATTARYARPDNRVIGKVRQSVNRLFRGIRSARR